VLLNEVGACFHTIFFFQIVFDFTVAHFLKKMLIYALLFLFLFRILAILCSSSLFFLALWVAREPLLPIHGILFCVDVLEYKVVVPQLFSNHLVCADRVQSMCRGLILFKSF